MLGPVRGAGAAWIQEELSGKERSDADCGLFHANDSERPRSRNSEHDPSPPFDGEPLAPRTLVDRARADSGVIDLFAIHRQASEAPPAPSPLASAPPPAFTTDLLSTPKSGPDLGLDLDDENPFANRSSKKKPVYFALIGAAGLLVIGVAIAAFSGGSEPAKPAAAAKQPAATAEPAPPAPPPVMAAVEPPKPAAPTPATPSTGAVETKPKAHAHAAVRKAAPKKSSGPKLQKVQSSGVPAN